ncbi:MAG: metallopeptidase family protein [Brevibacterium yomogidense]
MSPSRRHDRHGRSPLLFHAPVPAVRSRAEEFARVAAILLADIRLRVEGELDSVVLTVDDIPPVDADVELGRVLPATRDEPAVIVLHRLPIAQRCTDELDLADLIADVLADQVALLCGRDPDELRPR